MSLSQLPAQLGLTKGHISIFPPGPLLSMETDMVLVKYTAYLNSTQGVKRKGKSNLMQIQTKNTFFVRH